MIYEYRGLRIRVIADSKEEAIKKVKRALSTKISAMSFNREVLMDKIDNQTPNVIKWWCLCWYLKNIENKNGLLNHEKGKLKGVLRKLSELTFTGKNAERVKKNIMESLWIGGYGFVKKPGAVIANFIEKFIDEGIEDDEDRNQIIAKEFGKHVPKLIELLCQTEYSKISNYVDETF